MRLFTDSDLFDTDNIVVFFFENITSDQSALHYFILPFLLIELSGVFERYNVFI